MNLDEHIIRDILTSKLPNFLARLEKINTKLKSGGLPPIEIVNHGSHTRPVTLQGRGIVNLPMATISILRQAPSPSAQRVQVLAKTTLDSRLSSEAMTHKTYGNLTDEERNVIHHHPDPGACDHCSSKRNRAYIFTLKTPGGLMRVGGGCLTDFVGFDMSRWANSLNEVIESADKYAEVTFREMADNEVIPLRLFLSIANNLIEENGYRNRDMGESTGEQAFFLSQSAISGGMEREDPEHTVAVDQVLTFIKNSVHREQDAHSDYFVNLRTMADVGYLTTRQANLMASAPQAYRRYLRDLARQEEERKRLEGSSHIGMNFIGEKKQRMLFEDVVVSYVKPDSNFYGAFTKICFLDAAGNHFTWKASGVIEAEVGQTLQVLGTITDHESYYSKTYGKEIKDNKISRCQMLSVEEVLETRTKLAKAEAKARKKLGNDDPQP